MRELPDKRALGLPDKPYSAYCQVCWNNVYSLWIDTDHGGVCPLGHDAAHECHNARSFETMRAGVQKGLELMRATEDAA